MRAAEYETVTSQVARSVFVRMEGFPPSNVIFGQSSKWKGQSGFVHQIDVAIRGETDIIMVECKHWTTKKIKAEHLLAFIARINDIRPMLGECIHPVFVTCNRFQRGCHTLAKFYAVDLEVIVSADSFAFAYKGMRVLGMPPGSLELAGLAPSLVQAPIHKHVRQKQS